MWENCNQKMTSMSVNRVRESPFRESEFDRRLDDMLEDLGGAAGGQHGGLVQRMPGSNGAMAPYGGGMTNMSQQQFSSSSMQQSYSYSSSSSSQQQQQNQVKQSNLCIG